MNYTYNAYAVSMPMTMFICLCGMRKKLSNVIFFFIIIRKSLMYKFLVGFSRVMFEDKLKR